MSESKGRYISEKAFKKKTLTWEEFQIKARGHGVKIIDIRDHIQKGYMSAAEEVALNGKQQQNLKEFRARNKELLSLFGRNKVVSQSIDILHRNIVKNNVYQNQTMLIFDQGGTMIQWLMYHLEDAGIKNYFFLDKGIGSVIGTESYNNL